MNSLKSGFWGKMVAVSLACLSLMMASGAAPNVPQGSSTAAIKEEKFASLSGPVLVRKLLDAKTCPMAFYELWRRENRDENTSHAAFLEEHYEPRVVVCPQGAGHPPIYVVLSGFLEWFAYYLDGDYEIPNPSELFPLSVDQKGGRWWDEPAIDAFSSDGKRLEPFGGNTGLDRLGVIVDMNRDGFVERADHTSYGIEGIQEAGAFLEKPEYLVMMKRQVVMTAQTLTVGERKELAAFLEWYQCECIDFGGS